MDDSLSPHIALGNIRTSSRHPLFIVHTMSLKDEITRHKLRTILAFRKSVNSKEIAIHFLFSVQCLFLILVTATSQNKSNIDMAPEVERYTLYRHLNQICAKFPNESKTWTYLYWSIAKDCVSQIQHGHLSHSKIRR
jgi:hypothetical protein